MWIQSIVSNFFDIAQRYKNDIAIIDKDVYLSFEQVCNNALLLANIILKKECTKKIIALYLPKSSYTVISDIAILLSGNAFMNLDIKLPTHRLKSIIDNIQPAFFITNNECFNILEQIGIVKDNVIIINENDINFNKESTLIRCNKQLDKVIDTDLCCIINTSGSTGTPKGVALCHRSFIDFYEWSINEFNFSNNDIIGNLSPVYFDIYCFELCLLLLKGSKIVFIPEKYSAYPIKILQWLQKYDITFIFWVPTIMVNIANMELLNQYNLNKIRLVWFAGEVFPIKQLNYWRTYIKEAVFVNMYGPIEITLDCVYHIVTEPIDDNDPIPIGKPCKNTDILILNENNVLVKVGEIGELCVRGSSLALGYYNDFDRTSLVFTQNPLNVNYPETIYRTGDMVYYREDCNIMFVGRKDNQIKHMGYRIELGEIEQAALSISFIKNVCVVYNQEEKEIVMFFESANKLESKELWVHLMQLLPKYMLPTKYIQLEKIPTNPNGKIDRNYLANSIKK